MLRGLILTSLIVFVSSNLYAKEDNRYVYCTVTMSEKNKLYPSEDYAVLFSKIFKVRVDTLDPNVSRVELAGQFVNSLYKNIDGDGSLYDRYVEKYNFGGVIRQGCNFDHSTFEKAKTAYDIEHKSLMKKSRSSSEKKPCEFVGIVNWAYKDKPLYPSTNSLDYCE